MEYGRKAPGRLLMNTILRGMTNVDSHVVHVDESEYLCLSEEL